MLYKINMNNYYGKKRMIYNVNIYYKLAYNMIATNSKIKLKLYYYV